jgi:hypothetical protein
VRRCLNQSLKHSKIVKAFLGVPLEGKAKRIIHHLDSLNDSIKTSSTHSKRWRQVIDTLVVIHPTGHGRITAQNRLEQRPLLNIHHFGVKQAITSLVAMVAKNIRQVLVESPSQVDIEHLGASANAEYRHAEVECCAKQGVLKRITQVF